MPIPRAALLRLEAYGRLRHASLWGTWEWASKPTRHHGLGHCPWGFIPAGLSDERRKRYIEALRASFMLVLANELTEAEAREMHVFRVNERAPRHLHLDHLVALEEERSREVVVAAVAGVDFEDMVVPVEMPMASPLPVSWPPAPATVRSTWSVDRLRFR